jgi:hypothetical protein
VLLHKNKRNWALNKLIFTPKISQASIHISIQSIIKDKCPNSSKTSKNLPSPKNKSKKKKPILTPGTKNNKKKRKKNFRNRNQNLFSLIKRP